MSLMAFLVLHKLFTCHLRQSIALSVSSCLLNQDKQRLEEAIGLRQTLTTETKPNCLNNNYFRDN